MLDPLPEFRSTRLTHSPGSATKHDLLTNGASFRMVGNSETDPKLSVLIPKTSGSGSQKPENSGTAGSMTSARCREYLSGIVQGSASGQQVFVGVQSSTLYLALAKLL